MVVEVYEDTKTLMKYFSYNDKPGAHFPFNFQLIYLYNTSSFSRIPTYDPIEFKPKNIQNLIKSWTDVLPEKYSWSNWEVIDFTICSL
jgi:hypothetical protein